MKILCVEDDVFVRMTLSRTFRSEHEVVVASSGLMGASKLQTEPFALVVTDLNMPGMSGLELTRFVVESGLPTRVIVVSGAFGDGSVTAELRALGARCLSKPFRTTELRELVSASLDEYKARVAVGSAESTPDDNELLLKMERLTTRIRDGREFPSLDPRAADLVQRCAFQTPEIEELTEVVAGDPALSVQTLALINSAGLIGARRVTDVREACLRLGAVRLVGLLQELLVRHAIRVDRGEWAATFETMWKVARQTAQLATEAAQARADPSPGEVYVAGLLHNVGELLICFDAALVFDRATPEVLEAVGRLVAAEHEAVGQRVLRAWHMPRAVWSIAGNHHGEATRADELEARRRQMILAAWAAAVAELGPYLPALDTGAT